MKKNIQVSGRQRNDSRPSLNSAALENNQRFQASDNNDAYQEIQTGSNHTRITGKRNK